MAEETAAPNPRSDLLDILWSMDESLRRIAIALEVPPERVSAPPTTAIVVTAGEDSQPKDFLTERGLV